MTPKITASVKFAGPDIISTPAELRGNEVLRAAVRDKTVWQRIQLNVLIELQEARRSLKEVLEERLTAE